MIPEDSICLHTHQKLFEEICGPTASLLSLRLRARGESAIAVTMLSTIRGFPNEL